LHLAAVERPWHKDGGWKMPPDDARATHVWGSRWNCIPGCATVAFRRFF